MGEQNFGDRSIIERIFGDQDVGERSFGDQDVQEPARPASIHGDQEDAENGFNAGCDNAADAAVLWSGDPVRLKLSPDQVQSQPTSPPTHQMQNEQNQQPPRAKPTPPRRSGRQRFALRRYSQPPGK